MQVLTTALFVDCHRWPALHASAHHSARAPTRPQLLARHIERLVASFELTNQSLILEGVHLDVALITALLARHTSCIPFLIYISNEAKHRERFAVWSAP